MTSLKTKAFSLLELLVYLLLSGILLAFISNSFHALSKPFNVTRDKLTKQQKLRNLEDKIITSIYRNTYNSFLGTRKWHSQNHLPTYIIKRLENLPVTSRPGGNSILLEILDIDNGLFQRSDFITYRFQGSLNKSAFFNGSIKAWLSPEPLSNFLFLTKPEAHFLYNNITEIKFNKNEISLGYSILRTDDSVTESNPSILIPILDHYLLYTSQSKTFRRISLITSENQPILEGVSLEGSAPNSCFIGLESDDDRKQIACEDNQASDLMKLHAIDL